MSYQKVYMNHVFSSSTMSYVTQMWKRQLLCDAVIKTGSTITKAHRLVLLASSPMLQHLDDATIGSHLEVRLSAEIHPSSVKDFLQYIYEGYMTLSEENCKDVEKIAKILQVDSIINCCSDFIKCLSVKTGNYCGETSAVAFQESVEFRHVRATDIQKTVFDSHTKRSRDDSDRSSPGNKRGRLQQASVGTNTEFDSESEIDDQNGMSQMYGARSRNDNTDDTEVKNDSLVVVFNDPVAHDKHGWPKDQPNLPRRQREHGVEVSCLQKSRNIPQVVDMEVSNGLTTTPVILSSWSLTQENECAGSISGNCNFEKSSIPGNIHSSRTQQSSLRGDKNPANSATTISNKSSSPQLRRNAFESAPNLSSNAVNPSGNLYDDSGNTQDFSCNLHISPSNEQVSLQSSIGNIRNVGVSMVQNLQQRETSPEFKTESSFDENMPQSDSVITEKKIQELLLGHVMSNNHGNASQDLELSPSMIKTEQDDPDEVQIIEEQSSDQRKTPDTSGQDQSGQPDQNVRYTGIQTEYRENRKKGRQEDHSWSHLTPTRNFEEESSDSMLPVNTASSPPRDSMFPLNTASSPPRHSMFPLNTVSSPPRDSTFPVNTISSLPSGFSLPVSNVTLSPTEFECNLCNSKLSSEYELFEHVKKCMGDSCFGEKECPVCQRVFKSKKAFSHHLTRVHKHHKLYSCGVCSKSFMAFEELRIHRLMHSKDNNYPCSKCDKRFKFFNVLVNHYKSHSTERNFTCSVCSKSFKFKHVLATHEKTHTDVKEFECSLCHKWFKYKHVLQNHLKTHAGIRDFQCPICNKRFQYRHVLDKHLETHVRECIV